MVTVNHAHEESGAICFADCAEKVRHAVMGKDADILADIYQEEVNIAIWQRKLSASLQESVSELLASNTRVQACLYLTPKDALSNIQEALGKHGFPDLSEDMAKLVDMFCCLFELKRTSLRLTKLDRAMCPRFHVDRVPGRLVTTYQGVATQWLPHQLVNRAKLGTGNNGLPDHESGLFRNEGDIQQIGCGEVAMLKGELWDGNENAGLVHRSPSVAVGQSRLLLTLDFSD